MFEQLKIITKQSTSTHVLIWISTYKIIKRKINAYERSRETSKWGRRRGRPWPSSYAWTHAHAWAIWLRRTCDRRWRSAKPWAQTRPTYFVQKQNIKFKFSKSNFNRLWKFKTTKLNKTIIKIKNVLRKDHEPVAEIRGAQSGIASQDDVLEPVNDLIKI